MRDDQARIRFVRPYQAYRRGDVIVMDRGPSKSLVLHGYAVNHVDKQPLLEVAMVEHRDVETADAPRRRGRKAK
jgi:hypothetical protein